MTDDPQREDGDEASGAASAPARATPVAKPVPTREVPIAEEVGPPQKPPPDEPPETPRRHWGRRLAAVVLLAVVLAVVFLPQILSLGLVRRYAMDEANRRLPVRVEVRGWSLSWFGEQAVDGVAVRTRAGRPALAIDRVTLDRGLWDLAMDRTDVGPVRIAGGEAWADALDELVAEVREPTPVPEPSEPGEEPGVPPEEPEVPPEPPPPEPPAPEPEAPTGPGPAPLVPELVEVSGFTVHAGEDLVRIETATFTRGRGEDPRDTFQAEVEAVYGNQRGTFSAQGHITGLSSDWQGTGRLGGEVVVTAASLPLAPLVTAAAPAGAIQVSGTVGGTVSVNRSREGRLLVRTGLTGSGLQASGKVLRGDTPALEALTLKTEATVDQGAVTVGALAVTAATAEADAAAGEAQASASRQVAAVTASGTFALAAEGAPPAGRGTATIDLDLGRLAPMFRRSLGLHEGLVVESGRLTGRLTAATDAEASTVDLAADVKEFRGVRDGTAVALTPVHLEARLVRKTPAPEPTGEADDAGDTEAAAGEADDAADPSEAPPPAPKPTWVVLAENVEIDTFLITAEEFGQVTASGRLDRLVLDASLDVARASEEVGRFVDLGEYGGAGRAAVHLETGRSLEGDITSAATVKVADLRVDLPGDARLSEPEATVTSRSVLRFTPDHQLAEAELADLAVDARTASLTAKGALTREGEGWTFRAAATGTGSVANAAGVAAVLLPLLDRPEPTADAEGEEAMPADGLPEAEPSEPDAAEGGLPAEVLALCRRASAKDRPAEGTWTASFDADGTTGEVLGARVDLELADLKMPPAPPPPAAAGAEAAAPATGEGEAAPAAEPLELQRARLAADVVYRPGAARSVTVNAFHVDTPGATVTVEGPTTVQVAGAATTLDRAATATVTANLPALAQMLRPLGWMPPDPEMAGDVKVTLTATPGTDGPAKVNAQVVGEQIDLQWADGRAYADPRLLLMATALLPRDEAGDLTAVEVPEWSASTVAGAFKGTAAGAPVAGADGWQWTAVATGEGAVEPLAHTVARLLGAEHRPIRGVWNLSAEYAGEGPRVDLHVVATDLALPPPADAEAAADVPLQDMDVRVAVALGEEGAVTVEQASVTGPGLSAKGAGTVRLPDEAHPKPSADGQVEASADLETLADVLRPFGLLAEKDRLVGQAAFSGEVRTDETGLGGSGTLTLADVEVYRAASRTTLREAEARLPLVFAHVAEPDRWEVAARDMSAATARGSWRVAILEAEPRPRIEATCDVAFDGERVGDLLGDRLPDELTLAGPYRLQARVAGPLPEPSEEPAPGAPVAASPAAEADAPAPPTWHHDLAPFEGEGVLDVGRFTYATFKGGDGSVRWALGDGVLRLSPDPDEPSRLTVAEGTVMPAGRVLLTGPEPRFVIDERTRVVEDVPLAGEQVRAYLKYVSPVLAASVGASGRLTLDVVSLDLPLGEEAGPRAVGVLAYRIDEFQSQLFGPLGRLVGAGGGAGQSVEQTLGPVEVTLRDGVFTVPEHTFRYTEAVGLSFGGRIGLDKRMNVMVGVPVTQALLEQYKVSERAMPYLQDVVLAVPLKGTIEDPELDNEALAKRIGELALEAIKRETLKHLGDFFKR